MSSQAIAAQSKGLIKNKTVFHVTIALIIGIIVYLVLQPQDGQLTEAGIRVLSVTIPTIYLWVTLNTHWTCLLYPLLIVASGTMAPASVWQASMGNFIVMNALVFLILCMLLAERGIMDKLALWFMSRKMCRGRPFVFLGMFYLSKLIVGLSMSNTPISILYINLTTKITEQIGVKKGHSLNRILYIGTLWANGIQSSASPITFGIMMIGILAGMGVVVTMAQWLVAGLALSFLGIIVIMIGVRIYNPDVTLLKNLDIDLLVRDVPPLTKRAKATAVVVAATIALVMLPEFFILAGIFPDLFRWISGLTSPAIAIAGVVALCIIPCDGEQLLDFPKSVSKVPLTILLFIACIMLMTATIAAEWTGIVPWLSANISPLVDGFSPLTVMIILMILCVFQTNFLSSTVTMNLYFFVGVALLADTGISIGAWGILVAMAANVSILTPGASLTTPFWYGPGHVEMSFATKINLVFILLSIIKLVIMIPILLLIAP